jgi:hypothetical protein
MVRRRAGQGAVSYTNSLAMIVPALRQGICNSLMEACFRGPDTFSIPIRDKVSLARTAYAAHTYDDELIEFFVNGTPPAGVTLARLQAYGFATVSAARTAAGYIRYKVMSDRRARANVIARLDELGWEFEPVAAPVSSA